VSISLWRRWRLRRERRGRASAFVAIEQLEELQLLSAASTLNTVAIPLLSTVSGGSSSASSGQATPLVTNVSPLGHTPAQIEQAYGYNQISFDNGAIKGNGAGQTIAIVDAYYDPNIAGDLQKFDAQFGLAPPPNLSQFVEQGATINSGWSLETALDVEWAHAMAPAANIDLIEANNSSLGSLLSAVNYARNQANVSVVSMSWGAGEFAAETQYDSLFTTPSGHIGITFVASSGDAGAGTTWPSVSPNVLAVGGTSLTTNASGTYVGETAWSGSGGGVSSFESEPSYQTSVQSTGGRTTPDVAFNADPNSGFAVFDSVPYAGENGWFEVGGTSAGAPQWAALIAIADQGRSLSGQGSLSNAQATLYSLPVNDFHDVTSGSNGFAATTGYDLVTGRGSPVANSIVAALSGGSATPSEAAVATTTATSTSTTSSGSHTPHSPSTNPTSPTSPSSPTSPTAPTKTGDSRGVLNAALVAQQNVSPAQIIAGTLQIQPVPSVSITSTLQLPDQLAPLTSTFVSSAVLPTSNVTPVFTSVAPPPLSAPSLATDLGHRVSPASSLPELSTGLSQSGLTQTPSYEAIDEVFSNLETETMARAVGSFASGFVENGLSEAISHAAIDAFFATYGWPPQLPIADESPSSSSGFGKAALVGAAGSVGLAGLAVAIRNRRRQAAP
jgi:hypothetical protein